MGFLLYSPAGANTAKLLAKGLGFGKGQSTEVKHDKLIRYGATCAIPKKPDVVVNSKDAIVKAGDKKRSLEAFAANEVPCPPTFFKTTGWPSNMTFPCLLRKTHHTQGSDIIPILQPQDLSAAMTLPGSSEYTHATAYIPKKKEVRVHVYCETVLFSSVKVLQQAQVQMYLQKPWLWNFENGFKFVDNTEKLPASAKIIACTALEVLGLTFGAVDLILGTDNRWYVLEVNSAPSLKTLNHLNKYLDAFCSHLHVTKVQLTDADIAEVFGTNNGNEGD